MLNISLNPNKMNFKSALGTSVLVALFLVIGIYAYSKTKDLIWGVNLKIEGIYDGMIIPNDFLTLQGSALHVKSLRINSREVAIDQKGKFSDSLLVYPGYNIVTVSTEDKFGKSITKTFRIYSEAKDNEVQLEAEKLKAQEVIDPAQTTKTKVDSMKKKDNTKPI